jgi:antitoxin (DNA-binding transcriptional repressor) of toxin-antitoxin stability system
MLWEVLPYLVRSGPDCHFRRADFLISGRWTRVPSHLYIRSMGKHSIADAQGRLPELIDRALQGEEVVITRDGVAVVEVRPVTPVAPARPLTQEDMDRLAARRAGRIPSKIDAGTLLSQMRDEEEH